MSARNVSDSESETSSQEDERPHKRIRHSSQPARPPPKGNGSNGYMSSSAPTSTMLPPLSLSILGIEPLDEFIGEIANFVHHIISTRPMHLGGQVELEAKIGVLRERVSGQRINLPVLVETVMSPEYQELRFESNMSSMQHKHFNTLLNNLMTASLQPDYKHTPLKYTHQYLVDSFYPVDNPRERERIRVTRDEKTGAVLECMKKVRLGDLNIFSPKRAADWRVSVSLEIPVSHPIGSPTHTRRKDRLSYAHEEFVVDLTQVTASSGPNAPPEILHELEVEVARPDLLLATAAKRGDPKVSEHERSAFDELIRAFVNNARILVRNADEGWHQ